MSHCSLLARRCADRDNFGKQFSRENCRTMAILVEQSCALTLREADVTKDHASLIGGISLADHPSVEKRYRQSVKRRTRNIEIKSRLRTLVKKARLAIEAKNHEAATSQIQGVNKALGKAVSKGIVKKNTASRWLSRLSRSANRSKSAS